MVIIIGLYIILWAKSKDHTILSPSKDIEQAIVSPQKILANENKLIDNKDNLIRSQNNVVIKINPLKDTIVSEIECCC